MILFSCFLLELFNLDLGFQLGDLLSSLCLLHNLLGLLDLSLPFSALLLSFDSVLFDVSCDVVLLLGQSDLFLLSNSCFGIFLLDGILLLLLLVKLSNLSLGHLKLELVVLFIGVELGILLEFLGSDRRDLA